MSDENTVLLFQLVLGALNRCAIRQVQLHPAPSAKRVAICTHLMASPVPLHVIRYTSLIQTAEHAVRAGVCSNTPPHTMALSSSHPLQHCVPSIVKMAAHYEVTCVDVTALQ